MPLSGGTAIPLGFLLSSSEAAPFILSFGGVISVQLLFALAIMMSLICHWMSWGDILRFIGDDEEIAVMLGLSVNAARVGVFPASVSPPRCQACPRQWKGAAGPDMRALSVSEAGHGMKRRRRRGISTGRW